jgi:hypothetical protein
MQDFAGMHDYYKNAVIPPPQSPSEVIKYTRLAVDSKSRNKSLYRNPNSYEVRLTNEITDVISAKLINADIPMSMHMVNSYFDNLRVVVDGTTYSVTLDHGTYSESGLASMMEGKLNAATAATWIVTYNGVRDGFTFAASAGFSMVFGAQPNSLDALLGFDKETYASIDSGLGGAAPHSVTSEYRKNFLYNNCIIMYIDQFDTYQSPDNEMDRCFAILPAMYSQLSMSDHPELVKIFSPPIARLAKLVVSFYDRFGNPYDFQNMEHRFELLLTSNKQARKYNSIFGK